MSKIALEGNASGTGTFTIASPNSNSNYTLTLPSSTGTVVVTGGAQTIEFAAGSAASPSITFTGDTNTGIFSPAADTIAFAEGGVEAMRINSSGQVGIGTSSQNATLNLNNITADSKVFSINAASSRQYSFATANDLGAGGADLRFFGGDSDNKEYLYFSRTGNIGVGTTSPATKFHVVGSNNVTRFESSASNVSDYLTFYSGGANRTYFGIETDTGTGILGSGTAYSTILSTVGSQPLVFGTNSAERARITSGGNFGIGTNNPQQALDVNGVARAAYYFYQTNASSYASPSSTTLTMTYTGEGSLYLISASNHSGSSNVSHTMWMLSYSGTGASVVTQIATGGSYTPTISVSGSTVTITNNSGGSRVIYASFIRLL